MVTNLLIVHTSVHCIQVVFVWLRIFTVWKMTSCGEANVKARIQAGTIR